MTLPAAFSTEDLRAAYPGLSDRLIGDMARDAAFDYYLAFLAENDVWAKTGLVFKGGTAIRKFLCSPDDYHRISYDLDFTLREPVDGALLTSLLSTSAPYSGCNFALELGSHSRVRMDAPFLRDSVGVAFDATENLLMKPAQMLALQRRPVHDRMEIDVSFTTPVMTVDEVVAEKLTRWHHRPLIRDLYDLIKLRPAISDPASVVLMWIVKGHLAYHNPLKGATTSAPVPADFDGILNAPSVEALDLLDLRFDVPTSQHAKRAQVQRMLAEFSGAYEFCLEETDDELEAWASDTEGHHTAAVKEIADAMALYAKQTHATPPASVDGSTHSVEPSTVVDHESAVKCGQQLAPPRTCQRTLLTEPCPAHPDSPGSIRINERKQRSRRRSGG